MVVDRDVIDREGTEWSWNFDTEKSKPSSSDADEPAMPPLVASFAPALPPASSRQLLSRSHLFEILCQFKEDVWVDTGEGGIWFAGSKVPKLDRQEDQTRPNPTEESFLNQANILFLARSRSNEFRCPECGVATNAQSV